MRRFRWFLAISLAVAVVTNAAVDYAAGQRPLADIVPGLGGNEGPEPHNSSADVVIVEVENASDEPQAVANAAQSLRQDGLGVAQVALEQSSAEQEYNADNENEQGRKVPPAWAGRPEGPPGQGKAGAPQDQKKGPPKGVPRGRGRGGPHRQSHEGCTYFTTGRTLDGTEVRPWFRFQVFCDGLHAIVNYEGLEDGRPESIGDAKDMVEKWIDVNSPGKQGFDLYKLAETIRANPEADVSGAKDYISRLEAGEDSTEHINFFGRLGSLNRFRMEEKEVEMEVD